MREALLAQLESGWPEDQVITISPSDIAKHDFLMGLKEKGYEFRWSHVQRVRALTQTGWEPASDHEVQQFEKKFPVGTMARLAFDLLLCTGVRRSDVVRLGPPMEVENGRALRFVVTKGQRRLRKELELPILPTLRRSIDATKTGNETYIVGVQGRPLTAESFGNWFRDRCNEAGLPQCSAHGLRKAGATMAAERGASAHQLKAIFGWESITQAEDYTRRASQAKLAKSAMHLLERDGDEG